jgi:hypothetical protein
MFLVAANDCEVGVLAVTSSFIAVGSFYFLFSEILYYSFLFIRIFYVEQFAKIYVFLLSFFSVFYSISFSSFSSPNSSLNSNQNSPRTSDENDFTKELAEKK